ncbi:MAG: hypothetical protein Alpg2KO_16990 [Alphaproteobacteria bacterium]
MKVTIDIDCTPVEARTFLGLPDVQPVQEQIMAKLVAEAEKGMGGMDAASLMAKMMSPNLGSMQQFWQQVGEAATGAMASGAGATTASASTASTTDVKRKPAETTKTKVNPDGTPAHKWHKDPGEEE